VSVGQPCDVPTGTRKAGDESLAYRISIDREDDRKRAGRPPSSPHERPYAVHHQNIWLETDELRRQGGKFFGQACRVALLNDEVLTFHVPQISKPLPEGSDPALVTLRPLQRQISDPVHLPRRILRAT
jgi:hypothetical protein